jgi:hypothetical protein
LREPAQEIKRETVTTTGLEQLFQVDLEPQDQSQIQVQDQVELVPLAEAAKRLGVSRRYAHKLATGGKIAAEKDHNGRWLVKLEQGQIQVQDQVEPIKFQDQIQVEQPQFQIRFQDQVVHGYQNQVKDLQGKLEAATFRVGYLQAQLEASQQTIKLLEDKQKIAWWLRLKNLFSNDRK